MAAMNQLPFEIIAQIFTICVYENDVSPEGLASISQHLREVAAHTPELWNQVYYGVKRDRKRMLLYLARSGSAALDLEFFVNYSAEASEEAAQLIEDVEPHLERVRSLRLIHYEGYKRIERLTEIGGITAYHMLLDSFLRKLCESKLHPFRHAEACIGLNISFGVDFSFPSTTKTIDMGMQLLIPLEDLCAKFSLCSQLEILRLNLSWSSLDPFDLFLNTLAQLPQLHELDLILPGQTTISLQSQELLRSDPIVLNCLGSLTCSRYSVSILPYIQCPVLTTLSTTIEADQAIFLRRHSKTISKLDLSETFDMQLAEGSQAAMPLAFPSLNELSGHISNQGAGRLLGMIVGESLVRADLHFHWPVACGDVLRFFEASSASLESVTLTYDTVQSRQAPLDTPNLHVDTPTIRFPKLKSFISGCRIGDVVFSAIEEAPQLVKLQLYGLPRISEILSPVSQLQCRRCNTYSYFFHCLCTGRNVVRRPQPCSRFEYRLFQYRLFHYCFVSTTRIPHRLRVLQTPPSR